MTDRIQSCFGPKEYLEILKKTEDIREVAYSDSHIKKVYGDNPELLHIFESLKKEYHNDRKSYCISFYDILTSGLSMEIQQQLHKQLACGELLLKDVNATLRKAEGKYSGYIIIINRGLTSFFYSMIKLLLVRAEAYPSLNEKAQKESTPLLEFDAVVSLIRQLLKQYHEGLIPELELKDNIINSEMINLLITLHFYSISFVIAHELGHFLNGDMNNNQKMDKINCEFCADETGFIILLNYVYGKKDDFEIMRAIAGAVLALHYIDILEKTSRIKSSTHPPAEKRIARLREKFKFPKIYYELFNAITTLSHEIQKKI